MKITALQKRKLKRLICERLSSNKQNEELMKLFVSKRGESLVQYCQNRGMDEDQQGTTAYYLIKTKKGLPLLFFSVKCGALFTTLDEEKAEESYQRLSTVVQAIRNANENLGSEEEIRQILLDYQISDRMTSQDFKEMIYKKRAKGDFLYMLTRDKQKEPNSKINRVQETYPGIELVHFCANDQAREYWNSLDMPATMGTTLFWYFIAPIFINIRDVVGCEYAFLFAADTTEDETLVNYYESLNFAKQPTIGTNKPFYDFMCIFMGEKISWLEQNRKIFFETFNDRDSDAV